MRRRALFLVSVFLTFTHAPCFGQDEQNITLAEAEKIAIQNHPQIQVATYLASAATARVQQARSAYYPQAYGSLTGVDAERNSRVAAGGLNNPIIFERYSNAVTVGQLLTDNGQIELALPQKIFAMLAGARSLDTELMRERAGNCFQHSGIPICNENPHGAWIMYRLLQI